MTFPLFRFRRCVAEQVGRVFFGRDLAIRQANSDLLAASQALSQFMQRQAGYLPGEGAVSLERRIYYCAECGQTRVPLDERLGIKDTGITPGLSRVICRSALELPYRQSQQLLSDSLGFEPCSARETERIANQHGQRIEQMRGEGELSPAGGREPNAGRQRASL